MSWQVLLELGAMACIGVWIHRRLRAAPPARPSRIDDWEDRQW